jgi:hypothetical protein
MLDDPGIVRDGSGTLFLDPRGRFRAPGRPTEGPQGASREPPEPRGPGQQIQTPILFAGPYSQLYLRTFLFLFLSPLPPGEGPDCHFP